MRNDDLAKKIDALSKRFEDHATRELEKRVKEDLQGKVYSVFLSDKRHIGYSAKGIAQAIKIPKQQVQKALDELNYQGKIYSTYCVGLRVKVYYRNDLKSVW